MKKILSLLGIGFMVVSCNDSGTSDSTADTTTNTTDNTSTQLVPLSKDDSVFIMEAAVGGLTEVETGKLAQQNGFNGRVKNFGSMMEADHGKANGELMDLASSKGMSLPSSLPPDMQEHVDGMKKMTGKDFDKHYVDMMVDDHKKTIDKFEKQANSGSDAQLKAWASNTLPTLKKHLDSIQAIKKDL